MSRGEATNVQMTVRCGPVPCDTEEGRRFLQERLALFGKVCLVLGALLYVTINLLATTLGDASWSAWFAGPENGLFLGGCAIFAAVFLLARRGRRTQLQLGLIDGFGIFLLGVLLSLRSSSLVADGASGGAGSGADATTLLALTNVLLARAVIVPSFAAQTLVTSVLAVAALLTGSHGFGAGGMSGSVHAVAVDAAWLVIPVALAVLASRVIYGLQQEVREARQFGQYTLEERIGRGGMGEVYRARHAMLRRPTAIKLLRPEEAGERSLARFEREVQLTSRLEHPNTISIYDYGRTPAGVFYYAMEYLEGLTLQKLVEEDGPQPPARVIHILRQVCFSLAEAHDTGLIHRDIKPANIILCARGGLHDVVKVVDFGLVKPLDSRGDLTVTAANTITGTPLYLSPEGIRSPEKADARSDLYALGAVGFYLLCGDHVFRGDSLVEVYGHHLHTPPVPPSERLGKSLPEGLERAVLWCLEKDPDRRPRDARALQIALDRLDDVARWTEEDAARWWERRSDEVRRIEGQGTSELPPSEMPTRTVASTETASARTTAEAEAPRR